MSDFLKSDLFLLDKIILLSKTTTTTCLVVEINALMKYNYLCFISPESLECVESAPFMLCAADVNFVWAHELAVTVCSLSFIVWQWVRQACAVFRSQSSLYCSRQTNTVAHDNDLTQNKEYNGRSELESHDSDAALVSAWLLIFLFCRSFKDETRQWIFVCKRQTDEKKKKGWWEKWAILHSDAYAFLLFCTCTQPPGLPFSVHRCVPMWIHVSLWCLPLNLFACMVFVSTMCAFTDDPEDLTTRKANAACSCTN